MNPFSPRSLLTTEGMSRHDIELLFGRARLHARGLRAGTPLRSLAGRVVANLFFENSTRTRLSFERAAKALGADVLNFNAATSSVSKGESLVDTVRNVEALGANIIVLRHPASGAAHLVSQHVRCSVVNAGDGTHAHPSQALLDAFTLHERWGTLEGKTVAIVGDVLHSRVARSNLYCLTTLGARVVVAGPPTLVPGGARGARGPGAPLHRRGAGGGGRGDDAPGAARAAEGVHVPQLAASTRRRSASPWGAPGR